MTSWYILGFQAKELVTTGLPPTSIVHFHVLFMRVFTVGQSRRISEANNRQLQAQYCQIQQVAGNPRRGRFTVRII